MTEVQFPAGRLGAVQLATLLTGWRDDAPGTPGYAALAARLRTLVLDGRLPLHTVLPSERALAAALEVSRTLTTAAYRQLREDGFADGRQGSGTWTALPHGATDSLWLFGAPGVGTGDLSTAAPEALPELHGALTAALADLPRLLPGHGYFPAGLPELRAAIAERYTQRGLPTSAEEIVVTSGAGQAIHVVLGVLTGAGDRVLFEDPTWPQGPDGARAVGARPVGLPVEAGWDLDVLTGLLRRTGAGVALLMPDAQNPTGRLLDGPDRAGLAAALADAGCTAVIDETLAELDLRAALGVAGAVTPPPFGAGGRRGGVVHIGSASKIFWGGMRIGWVRAERGLVQRLVQARSRLDLGGPLVEQLAAVHLLQDVDAIVARRRTEFAARCRALQAALAHHLPTWEAPTPEAGLFVWCRLPEPTSVAVAQAARAAGLTLAAGQRFGVDGGHPARLRLTFAGPAEQLANAVTRLGAAVNAAGLAGPAARRPAAPPAPRDADVADAVV